MSTELYSTELYCLEKYKGFKIVVELDSEGKWEGIAFKYVKRRIHICAEHEGPNPEHVKAGLISSVDEYLGGGGE